MSKETKVRVANAFRAMKSIGISEDKVKPVLKTLLKLYDKNWELIEVENYRALADAIFEREEVAAAECSKKTMNNEAAEHPKQVANSEKEDCLEEEARATEEPERPLKRLRHRYRDGQTSNTNTSNTSIPRTPLIKPKEEPNEQPESHMLQFNGSLGIEELPQPSDESERVKSQAITCQSHGPNKGKQPTSPIALMANERCEPCKPSSIDRIQQNTSFRAETRSPSHPMRLRGRGKRSVSPQFREKRSVPESSSNAACPNESNIERDIVLSSKKKSVVSHALIKPKDEPITDEITHLEVPTAVSHQDPSNEGNSSCMNGTIEENEDPEQSASLSDDKIDGTATANELRNNGELAINTVDSLGAGGLNGSVDLQLDTELPSSLLPAPPCNGIDDESHLNKMASGDDGGTKIKNQENCAGETNDMRYATVLQPQVAPETIGPLNDVIDIAKGLEKVVITLVNEVNDESPSFFYIPQNAVFQNAYLNFSLARMGDNNCCSTCVGDCLSLSMPCACAHETGGEFAYTADGLVKEEFLNECISMNRDPKKHCQFFCKECALERSKNDDVIEPCKGHLVRKFIKECWWKCGCNKQCGNRVVQRGISRNLQVFMTPEGKGWGLRTLEDLPKGAFVCEYVGEVLTNSEVFDRVSRNCEGEKCSYTVFLDADWGSKGALRDEEALCLDATYYGNVARFINHRCYDSNLVEIPVEVETPDHHYYHLAFFTTRKVNAMEELTWDYGIDFDDNDFLIQAFSCLCGSNLCRNIKRFTRSRSASRR